MEKDELLDLEYTPTCIGLKTRTIYTRILNRTGIDKGNFTRIWRRDLETIFELYDQGFFGGFFTKNCGDRLYFRLSRRMTKSGGMTKFYREEGKYEISLAINLIFQTFHDVDREIRVNGIVCHDRLEATMRIFEHEMIHLLEFVLFGNSSCSRPRFRKLSRCIFGHTDVTHRLVTQEERAHKKFKLKVGDAVSFDYEGKMYTGFIHRITRRATVFVKDPVGGFTDRRGNRYVKYYIPLESLRPAGRCRERGNAGARRLRRH